MIYKLEARRPDTNIPSGNFDLAGEDAAIESWFVDTFEFFNSQSR
jgi:hypothetical protein